jgi:hypothetical protein
MEDNVVPIVKKDRRRRTLTDADIAAIRTAMASEHSCQFNMEEVQFVRDFLTIWKESRSTILKGFLALVGLGLIALIFLGATFKVHK